MNDLDRLSLLKFATATPFTDTTAFFEKLSIQFPQFGKNEIESYLQSKFEFKNEAEFHDVSVEIPTLEEVEQQEIENSLSASGSSPSSERNKRPRRDTATPEAPEEGTRSASPTPSLTVKTPSGRTLRSSVPVAPSEPRRLRSSK